MDGSGTRRQNKSNPLEEPAEKRNKQKNGGTQENQEVGPSSSIADRLVEMWRAGTNFPPVFTQENADDVKLKKVEAQCNTLTEINANLNARLASSEEQVGKLHGELQNEALMQERLIQKMDSVWSYMKDITDTVNYITTTLDDYKGRTEELSSQYHDISCVYGDNQILKAHAAQMTQTIHKQAEKLQELVETECQLNELKPKYQILFVEVESYKKQFHELDQDRSRMQKEIVQLEVASTELKRKYELMCASEVDKSNQQRQLHESEMQKIMKEIERLKVNAQTLQEERDDVFRLLAEKEQAMQEIKKAAESYKLTVENFRTELIEKTANCDRVNEEKAKCDLEIQEKNRQICEFGQELEGLRLTLTRKSQDLSNLEESKRSLQQQIEKNNLQTQDLEKKFGELAIKHRKEIDTLQQNLAQKTSELEDVEKKWAQADLEKESMRAELQQTTLLLQSIQKEKAELNHKLTLMSSTKEYEMGDLKYQVEKLSTQLQEKESQSAAENQDLKQSYAEIEKKYRDEIVGRKEICENFRTEAAGLNAQIKQLQQQNVEEAKQYKAQLDSAEGSLMEMRKSEEQLKEKLQVADNELAAAGRMIETLREQSLHIDQNNANLVQMETKLKASEQKNEDLQQKYYDITANLNEKIRILQQELDTAKTRAQEHRSFLRSESFLKHQKNLEMSENRAREFEEKYYAVHAQQESERMKNHNLQRQLEESQREVLELEEQRKKLDLQGMEINRKLSTFDRALQDHMVASLSTWKKDAVEESKRQSQKKVVIRSDVTLPPGTIAPMLPPKTPRIPKLQIKSILKALSPATPPRPSVDLISRASPLRSPKPKERSLQQSPSTPKSGEKIEAILEVPPRSSSPDSSAMDVDEFDLNGKEIFGEITHTPTGKKSRTSQPKGGKKFFKSRAAPHK